MKKRYEINLQKRISESQLADILANLGLKSRPATFKNNKIIRENISEDYQDEPCLFIMAQDNNLESHCVVSIENHALFVYCYDDYNDLFRVWDKFEIAINNIKLMNSIKEATIAESVMKKLNYK